MPLYDYACDACRKSRSDIRAVEERHLGPKCDTCGVSMKLQLSVVYGIVRNPAVPKRK